MKKKVYIDMHPLAREPSLFKMALSDRADGKTTEMITLGIESFDASGKACAFVRRFGTEFTPLFFDEFEKGMHVHGLVDGRDYDFKMPSKKDGVGRLYLEPLESDVKKPAFTFCPLTKAGRLKSSFGYETHKNVFIDEYIPLDGRYIPDEVTAILELYQTIDRDHFDNYVMIAGNKITRANPVFSFFGIESWKKGLNTYRNGALSLLVHANKGNVENCENGAFGDLVRGTMYEGDNAGEFLRDYGELIKAWHSEMALAYVAHRGALYGIFLSESDVVVDKATARKSDAPTICIEPQTRETGALWLDSLPKLRKTLQTYKYANRLFFANEIILNELQKLYATL